MRYINESREYDIDKGSYEEVLGALEYLLDEDAEMQGNRAWFKLPNRCSILLYKADSLLLVSCQSMSISIPFRDILNIRIDGTELVIDRGSLDFVSVSVR